MSTFTKAVLAWSLSAALSASPLTTAKNARPTLNAAGVNPATPVQIDFKITSNNVSTTTTAEVWNTRCTADFGANARVLDRTDYDNLTQKQGLVDLDLVNAVPLTTGQAALHLSYGAMAGDRTRGSVNSYCYNTPNTMPPVISETSTASSWGCTAATEAPVACVMVTPTCGAQAVHATNPITGNCQVFADACDLPIAWAKVSPAACKTATPPVVPTFDGKTNRLTISTATVTNLFGGATSTVSNAVLAWNPVT